MTLDPARRLAVLREVAAADPEGDVAFLLRLVENVTATVGGVVDVLAYYLDDDEGRRAMTSPSKVRWRWT